MKKMMCIALIITAVMLILPLGVLGKEPAAVQTAAKAEKKTEAAVTTDAFKVLDIESKEITQMSAKDYIFGVVAAEMPALYEFEALKAQAVAAYTYACYKREINEAEDYHITTDFTVDQSFKTKEQALKDWGEKGSVYAEKIENAISEVSGEKICYEGKPILAVYHAVSSGNTYNARDIWGGDYPYLKGVPSAGDRLASNYKKEYEFSKTELEKLLKAYIKSDYSELMGKSVLAENGTVKSVNVCGVSVEGSKIREALGLASSNFEIELSDGMYRFTTYGYGHGVGMSQYGADYMAKQGFNYKEILSHYYVNTEIVR